jgi:hypothetical protein
VGDVVSGIVPSRLSRVGRNFFGDLHGPFSPEHVMSFKTRFPGGDTQPR